MPPWVVSHHPLKITKPHFPAHFYLLLLLFFSSSASPFSLCIFSLPSASVGKFPLRVSAMPDLGNLSLSAPLTLSRCSSNDALDAPVKTLPNAFSSEPGSEPAFEPRVLKRTRGSLDRVKKPPIADKAFQDRLKDLPFLVGAPMMEECCFCCHFIYPGDDELLCSVRGCDARYHSECAKDAVGASNLKKFKCPQHVCFICKLKKQFRCVRCKIAFHSKCAPWSDSVVQLKDHPGQAVCWRHPSDWRLDRKTDASTSDISEVFCRLPLPFISEEFKIDFTWKDMDNKMEQPSPYVHIRRIKKKRSDADDGAGCTSCSSTSTCSDDCVCRVQCISCSKACRCSENCNNRPFRKEKKIKIVKTELCGWGVEAAETIDKGGFIIEYIGEVIDDALCEKRLWDMKYRGVQNFYMCEIRKDFTIDATFKGNTSRFLNHSCDPNCVLEKWQVDGETRVGVFAACSIEAGEPLTYDYSPPTQHNIERSPPTRPRATPCTQPRPRTQNAAQQRRPRVPPARPSSDEHWRMTPWRRRALASDPAKAMPHRPCTRTNSGERRGASSVICAIWSRGEMPLWCCKLSRLSRDKKENWQARPLLGFKTILILKDWILILVYYQSRDTIISIYRWRMMIPQSSIYKKGEFDKHSV
ncbi:Histone-lysine N-methyltransferase ASHR3 [Glycine max]|nr:Histone-lysine N-methyltransferase ASHR3 [Glycine max]